MPQNAVGKVCLITKKTWNNSTQKWSAESDIPLSELEELKMNSRLRWEEVESEGGITTLHFDNVAFNTPFLFAIVTILTETEP